MNKDPEKWNYIKTVVEFFKINSSINWNLKIKMINNFFHNVWFSKWVLPKICIHLKSIWLFKIKSNLKMKSYFIFSMKSHNKNKILSRIQIQRNFPELGELIRKYLFTFLVGVYACGKFQSLNLGHFDWIMRD